MSSIAIAYEWMPDPRDSSVLTETALLSRRYALALPESMPRTRVAVPDWQLAGLLDARREIDEDKMMPFATKVADRLFGPMNWSAGERAEIVSKLVNAYWRLLVLPCSEQPPDPDHDALAERFGMVVEIDGRRVVDAR